MGHIPPTPDLYFPECVSQIPCPCSSDVHNGSTAPEAEFLCDYIFADLDPLFRLVLPIHRDRAPIPRHDCRTPVWGKLSLYTKSLKLVLTEWQSL